jgi:hypothetical protein
MTSDLIPVVIHNIQVDKVTDSVGLISVLLHEEIRALTLQFKPEIATEACVGDEHARIQPWMKCYS